MFVYIFVVFNGDCSDVIYKTKCMCMYSVYTITLKIFIFSVGFNLFVLMRKKKDLYSMLVLNSKSVCWDLTQVGCFDVLFTPEHIVDMLENLDLD